MCLAANRSFNDQKKRSDNHSLALTCNQNYRLSESHVFIDIFLPRAEKKNLKDMLSLRLLSSCSLFAVRISRSFQLFFYSFILYYFPPSSFFVCFTFCVCFCFVWCLLGTCLKKWISLANNPEILYTDFFTTQTCRQKNIYFVSKWST